MSQGTHRPSASGPQDGDGASDVELTSTSELERGKIQPEVIYSMMEIMGRLEDDDGRIGASSGWVDEFWSSKSCVTIPLINQIFTDFLIFIFPSP